MARPALETGRLLEAVGDDRSRGMIVHDRTRLTGWLFPNYLLLFKSFGKLL